MRSPFRQPQQQRLFCDPFQRQYQSRDNCATASQATAGPSAETWDDTRIKPLYEQMLNQFHAADLDGWVSLAACSVCESAVLSSITVTILAFSCRNGVIDSDELRALLETFEDDSDRSTTHWLTGKH